MRGDKCILPTSRCNCSYGSACHVSHTWEHHLVVLLSNNQLRYRGKRADGETKEGQREERSSFLPNGK